MNATPLSLRQFLFDLIKPYKWGMIGLGLTALYGGIDISLSPYVLKLIIDQVVATQGDKTVIFHAVMPYLILYILCWILMAIAMRTSNWLQLKIYPSIRFDVIQRMFAYLTRHSHHYFQNNFAGSLANKILDMQASVVIVLSTLEDAFFQCIGLFIAIISMFMVSPIFALILLVWAVLFVLISVCFFKPIQELSNVFATSRTTLVGKIVDSIGNAANVRLFSRNTYENNQVEISTFDTCAKDRAMQWYLIKMRILWDISLILLMGSNTTILIQRYSQNLVSIGDFTFITAVSMSLFMGLRYISNQFITFANEVGKCKQALTILTEPHGIVDKPDAKPLVIKEGRIEFHQVTFHYDEGAHLFKNKNLCIEPGEKVGLVGFSGSGKSSLVSLILRLFEVESGIITIDGQNINDVTQDSLREHIALIPQDITLFHRNLLENIRYGRIDATDEEVIEASKKAHCHEFIMQIPNGYQSLVGERGIKLSGGQRQRIAIARAFLKDAPILILDEATSSLDSVTEKDIQDRLYELMKGRTTLVIAHRLSTLSEMDRILVLDNGQIIEDGSHDTLLQLNGHYAKMWQMQAGGFLPLQDNKTDKSI